MSSSAIARRSVGPSYIANAPKGDARPDARHREQRQEEIAGVGVRKAVQRHRILAHDHRRDQPGLAAAVQCRQGGRSRHDLVADACRLDDDVVEGDVEDLAANGCDHRAAFAFALIVALYLRCCSAAKCLGRRHARDHRGAPAVTDRQRQRVGRVGGCRFCLQRKDSRHHRGDLSLVRVAVTGDGGLDLAGRVEMHVDVALGGRERDDPAGLRGTHHRRHVLLGEDPLDRDDVGTVGVHPVFDGVADGQQPTLKGLVGRGADHVDVQRDDLPPRAALDDGQPATRQPGVDTHHPHGPAPCL